MDLPSSHLYLNSQPCINSKLRYRDIMRVVSILKGLSLFRDLPSQPCATAATIFTQTSSTKLDCPGGADLQEAETQVASCSDAATMVGVCG